MIYKIQINFEAKQNSSSNSNVSEKNMKPLPLMFPVHSHSVYFLCIYMNIYGDTYVGFSFLACLGK